MGEFKVKEFDVSGTIQDILDGQNTLFWKNMKRELEVWLAQIEGLLDDPTETAAERAMARLRGNREAVLHLLELPQTMTEYLEELQKDEEEKIEEEEN